MGQNLHPSTRATRAVRRAIRDSQDSLRVLARRYGLNPKTVAKWKQRESAEDLPRGPKPGRNRKLSAEEEGIIVRFREHTLLPLDDCLYALQAQIPHLTRSSLHRCLQRNGISRLSETRAPEALEMPQAQPLGDLHIDRSWVRSLEGPHCLFNAIEQAGKFVFVRMGSKGEAADAAQFLTTLARRSPLRIERVFTLGEEPFVAQGCETEFGRACRRLGIEHRLTPSAHPWTRGRGARIERMMQDSVTFTSEAHLRQLVEHFVHAYNFRRKLKTLRGKTPYEFLCRAWAEHPERFRRDPHHELVGLEITHARPRPRI